MFGYIRPYPPELKLKENEAFKGVYCGLCRQLGRSFGLWARMTLSYDFVFLAMINYAKLDEVPVIKQGRCGVNPFVKVPLCQSDRVMSHAADVAIIMIHYKIVDNIQDSGWLARQGWRLAKAFTGAPWKQAAQRQPEADGIVKEMMEHQRQVEQSLSSSLDSACEPTATALAALMAELVPEDNSNYNELKRLGYLTGRFVYICDAIEDIRQDIKRSEYNPLAIRFKLEDVEDKDGIQQAVEYGRSSIYMTIGELDRLLDHLRFTSFAPIIHNIVKYGMRHSADGITLKESVSLSENSI